MRFACLFGNGLSIAHDPQLSLPALTTRMLAEFAEFTGTEARVALRTYARDLSGSPAELYDALVGPFEAAGRVTPNLRSLQAVAATGAPHIETALEQSFQFLSDLRAAGLGFLLHLVADRVLDPNSPALRRTREALAALAPATIATCAYDGLLATGRPATDQRTPCGETPLPCRPVPAPHDDAVELLSLHGSIGWLTDEQGRVFEFDINDLSRAAYWAAFKERRVWMQPCVVLSDQKIEMVHEWPFSEMYQIFEERLVQADRWLVAGYGFGDVPTNRALQRALARRADPPKILLIGKYGSERELKQRASLACGFSDVLADVSGLPDALEGPIWRQWL